MHAVLLCKVRSMKSFYTVYLCGRLPFNSFGVQALMAVSKYGRPLLDNHSRTAPLSSFPAGCIRPILQVSRLLERGFRGSLEERWSPNQRTRDIDLLVYLYHRRQSWSIAFVHTCHPALVNIATREQSGHVQRHVPEPAEQPRSQ